MQKFLSLLFSRRALAVVGVLVLALLVWFVGPLVSFDTLRPLASVGSRVPVYHRKAYEQSSHRFTAYWSYQHKGAKECGLAETSSVLSHHARIFFAAGPA